ncbi:hypothetical protein [Salinimonas lutimaris]|uniref:hypothetical protein n=1 Tax=Salinimonas lutimaris TaxID=914153 RepID=UPI0010BFFEF3|nr:hypothetical protein [Salinimonas lutimaris]
MNDAVKSTLSFHASLLLFSLMASTLFFVFEFIAKPQILMGTVVSFISLEFMFFIKTRILPKEKRSAQQNL